VQAPIEDPATDLTEGIEGRMQTVEDVLRFAATERPLESEQEKKLSLYSTVGTSRLSRLILRSEYSRHFKTQMVTAIALVRRLVDIAANFQLAVSERTGAIDPADRQRCQNGGGAANKVTSAHRSSPSVVRPPLTGGRGWPSCQVI